MIVPSYATRRRVADAADIRVTARMDSQVDDAIASASREVEGVTNRVFYPVTRTMTWDWPGYTSAASWRLWLNDDELLSITAASSGGTTITPSVLLLRPDHGPPYNSVELPRNTLGGWTSGPTPQRAISITGLFGYDLNEVAAGTLAANVLVTDTTVTVSDSSVIGPESLIRVGTERLICTDAAMVTTGLTVGGAGLTATAGGTALTVSGTGLVRNETVLVDSERMRVVDVSGTTATVRRAWDGSVLAVHANGAAISAMRQLTVIRGALGTTTAIHTSADQIVRHVFPAGVVNLTVAIALAELGLETAGYTVQATRGQNKQTIASVDIADLTDRVFSQYGRKNRMRAV